MLIIILQLLVISVMIATIRTITMILIGKMKIFSVITMMMMIFLRLF